MKKIVEQGAGFFRRMLAMVLVIALIAGNFSVGSFAAQTAEGGADTPPRADTGSTGIDFSAYQDGNLDIYNYLYYTSANGALEQSGGRYEISGSNSSREIVIGNHPTETTGDKRPLDVDIPVSLAGLTMAQLMTVKPVGSTNQNKVALTVNAASTLGALVVEDNAQLELVFNAPLTVASVTLGENSRLTVSGSGTLTVSGAFDSRGTVALNGGSIQAKQGISAVNLSLNGAKVDANSNQIIASDTLSMQNSTVENASVFGYETGDATSEVRVLKLSGRNTFTNVQAVGCAADSPVRVSIEGIDTVSSGSGTTYYCDYSLTYLDKDGTEIAPTEDWPVAYRVSSDTASFDNAAIRGYHTASGYTAGERVSLPTDHQQQGYEHQGWILNDAGEPVSVITEALGNIILSEVLNAGAVTVSLDLGYTPDQYSNDRDADGNLPVQISITESRLDETITLPLPVRFGYKFKGWKVTSGTNQRELIDANGAQTQYTIQLDDRTVNDGKSVVTLEALWEADQFKLTLFLGSDVVVDDNLLISVDGGKTFQKFTELGQPTTPEGVDAVTGATTGSSILVIGRTIQFAPEWPIRYGQTISEYLRGLFTEMPEGTLPILKDASAAGTAQTFGGWSNEAGTIDGHTRFLYGEGGMLTPGDKALTDYQKDLHENNAAINAVWGIMSYDLVFSGNQADGTVTVGGAQKENVWTILVDGREVSTAESGRISVPQGSTVTLRTYAVSPLNFCLWNVMETASRDKIIPTEQPYHSGDQYLEYKFVMPAADVTADYGAGDQLWVDLFQSPITFAERVTHNGRTLNGFWYDVPMIYQEYQGMKVNALTYWFQDEVTGKYFYIWDFASKFYVTSCDQSTVNQLHIVNAMDVTLRHCNLACREAYLTDCVGDKIKDSIMAYRYDGYDATVDYTPYANVLIDLSQNDKYKLQINIEGKNSIGVIATDHLYKNAAHVGELILRGQGEAQTELTLGTLFSCMTTTLHSMTIKENPESRSMFLTYFNGYYNTGSEQFQYVTLQAENKWLWDGRNSASIYQCKDFRVGNIHFLWFYMNNSNIRVKGDLVTSTHGAGASSSTVVIDGNLIYTNLYNGSTTISNSVYIVKGTVCDLHGANISGDSFVIANIVAVDAGIGVYGNSVVVANMLTAGVHAEAKWSHADQCYKLKDVSLYDSTHIYDGNEEPFVTYTKRQHDNAGAYTNKYYFFGNSATYLMGYYRTKPANKDGRELKIYDLSVRALDADNPIRPLMNSMLDETGGYNGSRPDAATLKSGVAAAAERYTEPVECISFGDTRYPEEENKRKYVKVYDAAGLYAAGNVTFFNETTVSGGTIECAGTFSSKRDLTVTGGTIRAKEIGNTYCLTMEDGPALRWQKATFENCTLITDRIGALSREIYEEPSRSTVTIGENVNVQALADTGETELVSDIYVNYFYDDAVFSLEGLTLPENLRFTDRLPNGIGTMHGLQLDLARQDFAPPIVIAGGEGQWRHNSLSGYPVEHVGKNGYCNSDTAQDLVYDANQLSLFAVKTEYTLTLAEGQDLIDGASCDGVPLTPEEGNYTVRADGTVTLTLADPSWTNKTVVWYQDAAGLFHNVEDFTAEGTTVSFKMPASDAKVFVTDELKVYLDLFPISFTEDGFAVEEPGDDRRADSVFTYGGNFLVTQQQPDATYHRIFFESAEAGNVTVDGQISRRITLKGVNQISNSTLNGIDLTDGARVQLLLDGANYVCPVGVPQHAEFVLKGKTGADSDTLYARTYQAIPFGSVAFIYGSEGRLGASSIQDVSLRYARNVGNVHYTNYVRIFYSYSGSSNPVSLVNVKGPSDGFQYSHSDLLANGVQNITIDGCDLAFVGLLGTPFISCGNLEVRNSRLKFQYGTGTSGYNLFSGLTGSTHITDSTVEFCLNGRDASGHIYENIGLTGNVTLDGSSTLKVDHRLTVKELHLADQAQVIVGGEGDTGYLFCPDITVADAAGIQSDYIFVSGFNTKGFMDVSSLMQSMEAGTGILDGEAYSGLVLNGGTVTAKEFVGGDRSGKITVNGGKLEAARIGTLGKLCGYPRLIPKTDETVFAYFTETIPTGAVVNITGGEVDVGSYLGGMHTDVNISGGTVNLGEDAILGLTDAQQTILTNDATAHGVKPANFGSLTMTGGTVEGTINEAQKKGGSIQVPYGTVNISGENTAISVYNMMAYCGDMTISNVTGSAYTNPYKGTDIIDGHEKLGIRVINRMSAKNLTIRDGSVVYAKYAYANVEKGEEGNLSVIVEEPGRAYLYVTNAYGIIGEGDGSYAYNDGTGEEKEKQNVFGTKVVDVHYIIQPRNVFLTEDLGKELNPNMDPANGLPYYVVSTDTTDARFYLLKDASCSGYEFLGWYEYDPETKELGKERVYKIDTSNSKDVYLGAKWRKVQVEFEVQIELDDPTEFVPGAMEKVAGTEKLYRFTRRAVVTYGDQIRTTDGVLLAYYTTNTLGVLEIAYNGHPVQKADRVTAQMADDFLAKDGKEPLILMVTPNGRQKLNVLITLDQNKNDKNRPLYTQFNLMPGTLTDGGDTADRVMVNETITATLGGIPAFANPAQPNGLILPTAPGYTFGGWYTNSGCTGDAVTSSAKLNDLHNANATTLYAKWTPNTYLVHFNAAGHDEDTVTDNRWVTAGNTAPAVNDPTNDSMEYNWVYDTAPGTSANGFWVADAGDNRQYQTTLPCAWREGYVFLGWYFIDANGEKQWVERERELNKDNMDCLNVANDVTVSEAPALELYAAYRPVEVSYELNGGSWITEPTTNPVYGAPLAGYSKQIDSTLTAADYTKLGTAFGADGTTEYWALSTTSRYFADHDNQYVNGDYRESFSRKGYTFQGWRKDGDNANFYGCTPRFEDLTLTAEWKENAYTLKLQVKDEDYNKYESLFSNPVPSTVMIPVTVGSEISGGTWPAKTDWYAYNSGETDGEKHRLLLGATFAALDPGDSNNTDPGSVYLRYAEAVTNMLNSKTLFDKGDTFFLPEDEAYASDLAGAVPTKPLMSSVPDYPTGSEIPMYGVYRERSLVFIEEYVDSEGVTQSKVLYSHPWSQYTDYPFRTYPTDPEGNYQDLIAPGSGYALAGWYVGSRTIDESRKYPEPENQANFYANILEWKEHASHNTYDINVYTAYVAQQTISQTLTAEEDPTKTNPPSVFHALPGSMQEGYLSYRIGETAGLKLVDRQMMLDHQYDSTWEANGVTYSADDTVAIELRLVKDETTAPIDPVCLSVADAAQALGGIAGARQYIGNGWKIILTLYHSKVMTQAAKDYTFEIEFTFEKRNSNGDNTLADQWLKNQLTVQLKPSIYEVEYQVNLPENMDQLVPTENGFAATADAKVYHKTVKQAYGSQLLPADETLMLEGYVREESWKYADTALTDLMLHSVSGKDTELADGKLTVYAGYVPEEYTLARDDSTVPADACTITYGDGANGTAVTTLSGSSAEVKYHSLVTFTLGQHQPAEYFTLTFADGTTARLDVYAQKQADGTYTFAMPAKDVTVSYSKVMDLYLDNGTIELFPDGFKQVEKYGDRLITWPGDYRILQCEGDNADFHPTVGEKVLKLSGDLTRRNDGTGDTREISLGRLNISSPNSIELLDGCTVNLTQKGELEAQNILVPKGTNLTVTGDQGKTIVLEPEDADRAAIGATEENDENGAITLQNVDLTMTLKAPSVSSGIGPGTQNGTKTYGAVTVTDSKITVKETSNSYSQYTGAWIGGAGVASVNLRNTTVVVDVGNANHGSKAVDGTTVTLTECRIGEEAAPVKEPIHAANDLKIVDCTIYQQNDYNLGHASMIGTDAGTTTVKNSTVQIGYGGNGNTDKLYTGKLLIEDAASDITIDGTQILEVSNGDITMEASGVTQGEATHAHSGLSYLLLEEKDAPDTAPKLTVNGLGDNKTITVQQPVDTGKTVTIGTMAIQDDAKLILEGNLIATDTASVAKDQTLTVEGGSHSVTYEKGLSGDGNYVQTGGNLTGNADVVVGGNMTLTDVTANCGDHRIGSNGGSAPTDATAGTATTVTIHGGSVTAQTIGACGAQNETFTFVKTEADPAIHGILSQDHYRLNYELGGINADLVDAAGKPLPTVLRTETDYTAGTPGVTTLDSKPANPTGQDEAAFLCWYIWSGDGTQRLGLLEPGEELPQGLDGKTLLTKDTESNEKEGPAADGTYTLKVYAWLKASGTVTIKPGRVFESFDDGGISAEVSSRGVWTAKLVSNGTYIAGRNYQVEFANALPAGTDLTLTVIAPDGSRTYYHYTPSEPKTTVKFSEFTLMGTTGGVLPTFVGSEAAEEILLLSADFGELADSAAPKGGSVKFSVILENGTTSIHLGAAEGVSYTVSPVVIGEIATNGNAVTVQTPPSGEEKRAGETVYLVGTLSMTGQPKLKVPLDASASLTATGTTIPGQWISGDTVAFELGTYGAIAANTDNIFSFEALNAGSYSIAWRLCTGEAPNMLHGVCSNEVTSAMTVAAQPEPMLKVIAAADSRVLAADASHTVSFDYTTTANSFTITVEKQTILANFAEKTSQTVTTTIAAGDQTASGTVSLDLPAAPGTYRVRFSLAEGSENDDVYYTFIVK